MIPIQSGVEELRQRRGRRPLQSTGTVLLHNTQTDPSTAESCPLGPVTVQCCESAGEARRPPAARRSAKVTFREAAAACRSAPHVSSRALRRGAAQQTSVAGLFTCDVTGKPAEAAPGTLTVGQASMGNKIPRPPRSAALAPSLATSTPKTG